jgi:phytoene synthase
MALKKEFVQIQVLHTIMNANHNLDYKECRRIMRAASKNYTFASYFLPKEKTPHIEALYALLRVGDDRVDVNHHGFSSPQAAIEDWRDSYLHAFEHGNSRYPVLRAYLNTAYQFDIPSTLLLPYFRAMIEDLTTTRFPKYDNLLSYMEGSAMVVGRAMCHILGTTTPKISDAYTPADSLSVAMQLSNFWRDIGEDWQKGRIYIPQEDMLQFGYTEADLANKVVDERLARLLEFEFERTQNYYDQACQGVRLLVSGRWSVMISLETYRAIIDQMRINQYDVFNLRASVPIWRKVWLAAQSWWQVKEMS